jgi:hypothetical protein
MKIIYAFRTYTTRVSKINPDCILYWPLPCAGDSHDSQAINAIHLSRFSYSFIQSHQSHLGFDLHVKPSHENSIYSKSNYKTFLAVGAPAPKAKNGEEIALVIYAKSHFCVFRNINNLVVFRGLKKTRKNRSKMAFFGGRHA